MNASSSGDCWEGWTRCIYPVWEQDIAESGGALPGGIFINLSYINSLIAG
jgi:hypothetical protein